MLRQLLLEESIYLNVEGINREVVLTEMMARLSVTGFNSKKKRDVLELLLQRERFGTTAIGDGVAIPRCVYKEIEAPILALGISRNGIDYKALDGNPVHLVFLLAFPEAYPLNQKQKFLQDLEFLMRDRFLRERLKISESMTEAYEILCRESEHLLLPQKIQVAV